MDIRAKGRLAGLTFLGLAFVANNVFPSVGPAVASGSRSPATSEETLTRTTDAHETARRHFPRFLEHVLDQNGHTRGDAAIKIAVPRTGGGSDMTWVTPVAAATGAYSGRPNNQALSRSGAASDDLVTFDIAQVRDWTFFGPDGRMYGNFTARAALPDLDVDQAASITALLSATAIPDRW